MLEHYYLKVPLEPYEVFERFINLNIGEYAKFIILSKVDFYDGIDYVDFMQLLEEQADELGITLDPHFFVRTKTIPLCILTSDTKPLMITSEYFGDIDELVEFVESTDSKIVNYDGFLYTWDDFLSKLYELNELETFPSHDYFSKEFYWQSE